MQAAAAFFGLRLLRGPGCLLQTALAGSPRPMQASLDTTVPACTITRHGHSGTRPWDIGDWLRHLGLGQYEASFRQNEVNESVLPKLTQEDLKEIGVGPVGHRRIILDAIAALRTSADAKAPPPEAPSTVPKPAQDTAERRQVTVMFSDLVGSTALSARMDPEDLREIISAYQKCVAETVRRFGGFVAKYMGDGVLIYFGYPEAHEDDAEQALRAVPLFAISKII